MYRIPHPILGWVLEPNRSKSLRMPEATVHVSYNSKGWRDSEHTTENPQQLFRILVLGDSFMEAYNVNLSDAFHRQIKGLALNWGIAIEVINLGVGGYGTLQEYLAFKEVGRFYRPDLVLLGFFVQNDVRNNSFELESIVSTGSMKVESRPFLASSPSSVWMTTRIDFESAQRRYTAAKEQQNTLPAKLASYSALMRLSRRTAHQILRKIEENPGQPIETKLEASLNKKVSLANSGVNYCSEPAEYTRAWDITKRILARLKRDTKASGSKLIVFSVPSLVDVSIPEMEKVRASAQIPDELCIEQGPGYVRLNEVLKELDIEYVELLQAFRRVMRDENTSLFRRSDPHWNPEGHALAAEQVFSSLVQRDLLPIPGKGAARKSRAWGRN